MGMAHLLGQLVLSASPHLALPLLQRAAASASLTVPQPAYVYALILLGEFDAAGPPVPTQLLLSLKTHDGLPLIPRGSSREAEARKYLEAAAYFHFPAAQYKLGHCFEFAEPSGVFAFDPLKSVQWYALASENGEAEADMALSKWFLCGSSPQGAFCSLSYSNYDINFRYFVRPATPTWWRIREG
jgi:TPR repeat protein